MLSVPGPSLRSCQGVSRRELLRAGGLGLLGLTLPGLLAGRAHAKPSGPRRHPTFGKAKSCLLVFLNGGCSHLDYIAVNGPIRAGQHAGFLGPRYDPLVPHGDPDSPDFQPQDLGLVPAVGPDRMRDRRDLLGAVNGRAAPLLDGPAGRTLDNYYE